LLTLDDLSLDGASTSSLDQNIVELTLVDHNSLGKHLAKDYGQRVVAIIDHHADERLPLADGAAGPRIVVKSGSCTSLIVNFIQSDWNALFPLSIAKRDGADADAAIKCSAQAATLALASILIDTNNLTEASKTTEADIVAVEFLRSKLPPTFDAASFFAHIQKAKQGIEGLSLEDVLRKDYKQFVAGDLTLGMSSAVRSLAYLAHELEGESRPGSSVVSRAREFAKSRRLDVYMIMTAYTGVTGDFQRDLFVCGLSPRGIAAARSFGEQHGDDLGLEGLEGDWSATSGAPDEYQRAFRQRALHQSRKQVAPIMNDLMAQL
jgi:exopolyphosphatase